MLKNVYLTIQRNRIDMTLAERGVVFSRTCTESVYTLWRSAR